LQIGQSGNPKRGIAAGRAAGWTLQFRGAPAGLQGVPVSQRADARRKHSHCTAASRRGTAMKDLTLSVVIVLMIALGIGLAFHWLYPRVDITAQLAGLFVFVAVALKLTFAKLWSLLHKPGAQADR
jgi:hypothetical protein